MAEGDTNSREINIPPQQILANSKGGAYNQRGRNFEWVRYDCSIYAYYWHVSDNNNNTCKAHSDDLENASWKLFISSQARFSLVNSYWLPQRYKKKTLLSHIAWLSYTGVRLWSHLKKQARSHDFHKGDYYLIRVYYIMSMRSQRM